MKPTTETLTFSSMPKTYKGPVSLPAPCPIYDQATHEGQMLIVFQPAASMEDFFLQMSKLGREIPQNQEVVLKNSGKPTLHSGEGQDPFNKEIPLCV